MSNVRHLTKTSGFLTTNSQASKEYTDFDAAHFRTPELNWLPPHPYCPAQVLLTEARQGVPLPAMPLEVTSQEQVQWEQLLASDSLARLTFSASAVRFTARLPGQACKPGWSHENSRNETESHSALTNFM